MECPGTELFQLMVEGQLTPEQQGALADHAATCSACHAVVEAMVTHDGPAPGDARPLTVGSMIGGRFRIDEVLGAGGMGIVVAATHIELGNRVAIKFMRDSKLQSAEAVERFMREARAVAKLRTEHVCRVLDVARLDTGAPYIVMELLAGVDLARTIASRPLPATIAVEYIMQAAVALAEAHAAGIVHRDLKPANLFVTRRSDGGPLVKVLDFGIAKALSDSDSRLTRTRAMLGSPGYISPEQLESPRDVDGRSDIWALGVTLYQLLSGRLPFMGKTATEIAVKIVAEDPAPLEVDPPLAAVVRRCLAKSPGDRYQDVAALAADLQPFGGPRARKIVAAVARSASAARVPTPVELPAAPRDAVTAATAATGTRTPSVVTAAAASRTRAASHGVAAGSRRGRRRGAPRWQLVVAGVVGLAAVITIGITIRGLLQRGDEIAAAPDPARIGSATSSAAPGPGAPVAVPPQGATGSLPIPPSAGTHAPPAPAAPAPTAPAPTTPSAPPSSPRAIEPARGSDGTPTPLSSFAAELQRACPATLDPARAAALRERLSSLIVDCWCRPGDPVHARTAFGWLAVRDREAVRRACQNFGVPL